MPNSNERGGSWNLEAFLDSLLLELDKAQDTLAVKSLSRPLAYSVKDVSLDLQVFPHFDGDDLSFTTPKPGEKGASRIAFQFGSITKEQIRRTTKDPMQRDDISIDEIDELDEDVKTSLKKYGITSASDLDRWESKNVDVRNLVGEKMKSKRSSEPEDADSPKKKAPESDYSNLSNLINKARRRKQAPMVKSVSLSQEGGQTFLRVRGANLATTASRGEFPVAMLGGQRLNVVFATPEEVRMEITDNHLGAARQELQMALDPYAVLRMNLEEGAKESL